MNKSIAFLVQNNHVLFNSIPVAQYALRNGIELLDRSSSQQFDPMNTDVDWSKYDIIVPYGSVQFARLCREKGLADHIFYSEEGFRTDLWIEKFGTKALNYTGTLMKASEVFEHLGYAKEAHVRPNHVDKAFVAAVFDQAGWDAIRQERNIEDDLDVFVSPPMHIDAEFRCWIVDGVVFEMSSYRQNGEMFVERVVNLDGNIVRLAQELADVYLPDRAVVMDIAVRGSEVYFLEFNSIHSSGWYAADINRVWDRFIDWRMHDGL